MNRRGATPALAAAALLTGSCSAGTSATAARPGTASHRPPNATATTTASRTLSPPRMIGFGSYMSNRGGGFEATKLIRVDPTTLATEPGPALRLRDAATGWVFGPDRRAVAVGGYNFGELLTLDVQAWQSKSIQVVPPRGTGIDPEIVPVVWPRADRLIAYAESFGAHQLFPATVLVIDPASGQVVHRIRPRGSVLAAVRTGDGAAALLICPVNHVGSTRLLLLDPAGRTRTVPLTRIHGGYTDSGLPGESMNRTPALVAHGNTVYAIGAQDPVAAIDVRHATVAYHDVPGMMATALAGDNYQATGSGGSLSEIQRDAHWLGADRILVTGNEAYPVGQDSYMHEFSRAANVLDVAHWQVTTVLPTVDSTSDVADGLIVANLYSSHRQVLRRDGTVVFTHRGNRSWTLVGKRLIEAGLNGGHAVELDVHTGRVIRHLPGLAVWPLAVSSWPATRDDWDAHALDQ